MRIQYRRAARWASLNTYVATGCNLEKEQPSPHRPVVDDVEDQNVFTTNNSNDMEKDVIIVDVDDRPFIPGAVGYENSRYIGIGGREEAEKKDQAYTMEQLLARDESDTSSDCDAAIRAWLYEKQEESAAVALRC